MSRDRDLGMARGISRRDFVQGTAAAAGAASLLSAAPAVMAASPAAWPPAMADTYPPLRTGMRGFHPGSFEAAHDLAFSGIEPGQASSTGEMYDLVVVGAGLSGLAAAYYYRQQAGPSARVLVIDNLESFGGHAQRNEFEHDGHVRLANGGSAYMVAPSTWSREAKSILQDLGIGPGAASDRVDRDLYASLGMGQGAFFPRERYGRDALVRGSINTPGDDFLAAAPMSDELRAELRRLMTGTDDYMAGMPEAEKIAALKAMSYRDYLLDVAGFSPEILPFTQGVWCLGTDTSSAWFAFFRHKPGFQGLGLTRPDNSPEGSSDDFTLPGGNSDIARLIVRELIPDSLPAGTFEEVQTERVDYSVLDREANSTRIRLSSIVLGVRHAGPPPPRFQPENRDVEVTYVTGGQVRSVKAGNVILACFNGVVPHICPELPQAQKDALRQSVRAANQITNVLFRNWEAFVQAGVSNAVCLDSFYGRIGLAAPRYLGGLAPARDPSEPVVVGFSTGGNSGILSNPAMVSELLDGHPPEIGMSMDDQFRMVRMGLLEAPFELFERHVREQSARVLAGADFDPARDILAITVNRWPHGFALGRNSLFSPEQEPGAPPPPVIARQKHGRIAIANSDADGAGLVQTAFDQAYRAVNDLQPRAYGYYEQF